MTLRRPATLLSVIGIACLGLVAARARLIARPASTAATAAPVQGHDGGATDWPQWRGPNRNGLSKETGLLAQWPASGPSLLWSISSVGGGYGSISVAGDRVFVQGAKDRQSIVYALNRADGKGVWSKALGAAGTNDRGSGP